MPGPSPAGDTRSNLSSLQVEPLVAAISFASAWYAA
jgi:hypothetical protein